jgi:hypothetical protein
MRSISCARMKAFCSVAYVNSVPPLERAGRAKTSTALEALGAAQAAEQYTWIVAPDRLTALICVRMAEGLDMDSMFRCLDGQVWTCGGATFGD